MGFSQTGENRCPFRVKNNKSATLSLLISAGSATNEMGPLVLKLTTFCDYLDKY